MAIDQFERVCEENRILYQRFIWLMVEEILAAEERKKTVIINTVAQESQSVTKNEEIHG